MKRPDEFEELAVFLGASYFRSRGRDQQYGLSARGLALKTGAPEGEEFPLFRAFWIEEPYLESSTTIVHALLDGSSTSGAYRFSIRPGLPTVMDVEATLFPRVSLDEVGLAPASTMFYFGPIGRERFDDWRPEVHDSDGLLMVTGRGEQIWRPLANPRTLQISAFVDNSPRGFGLIQRNRDLTNFQDFESHYERRPGLWVEPVGDWGSGAVALIEIPSDSEIHDNISAFWDPKTPLAPGSEYAFAYRLSWGEEPDLATSVVVTSSRLGRASVRTDVRRFVVDFKVRGNSPIVLVPVADVSANHGTLSGISVKANPLNHGWRLSFALDPGSTEIVELRAVLRFDGGSRSETWLYRWTR